MQLQIIGKYRTPRALRNIDVLDKFNKDYVAQKKAWQYGSTSLKLFHRINRHARARDETYYLICDNASVHVFAAKILDPNGSQQEYDGLYRSRCIDNLYEYKCCICLELTRSHGC